MRSHPGDAALLLARKVAYLLGATELALNYSYAYYAGDEPTLLRWLPVGAWLLVPLGLAGLADRARLQPRTYLAWAIAVPAYGLSVAAFFVSSRYRLPLLLPLAAGAGFALVRLLQLVRTGGRRGLALYATALAALGAVTLWPHGLDDGRAEERTAMLLWLVDSGAGDEALRRLPALEASHPLPALLLYRLGVALDEGGRAGDAVPLLERAASRGERPQIALALGQALLDSGRAGEAVPHLRAAWQARVTARGRRLRPRPGARAERQRQRGRLRARTPRDAARPRRHECSGNRHGRARPAPAGPRAALRRRGPGRRCHGRPRPGRPRNRVAPG